jgi:hypothetical protein
MLTFESGAVAAGDAHTCASSVGTGVLYCWGDNGAGEIGSGATDLNPHPTPIETGLSGVVDVVAGGDSTCARVKAGTVYCWGENGNGQLGIGSTMNQSTPTALTLLGATQLAMGSAHAGAITSSGLLMWGSNADGQLGDATLVNSISRRRSSCQASPRSAWPLPARAPSRQAERCTAGARTPSASSATGRRPTATRPCASCGLSAVGWQRPRSGLARTATCAATARGSRSRPADRCRAP